ncbi:hypothetical protein HDU77_009196 [Chytriomyces hyalinus]|nr:hypothetical protein HDU77_009196 [Chytriomyces hyalinus]
MSTFINVNSNDNERTPLLSTSNNSNTTRAQTEAQIAHGQVPINPSIQSTQLPTHPQLVPIKKVMVPLRVEPKVYFANERTFLSWLHFCVVLGGLALGLLNFGDRVAQLSGLVFTLVAMVFMGYSVRLYQTRSDMIRRRDPGPYDDQTGPVVLCGVLFFAIGLNFYLKFTSPTNLIF